MKKTIYAVLGAVVILGVSVLAGEMFHRAQTPQPTETSTVTQSAVQAAATTNTPKTTVGAADEDDIATALRTTAAASELSAQTAMSGVTTGARGSFTHLFPLEPVQFTAPDPNNTRGLSTTRIDHSFGVAKNEQPHSISVELQKKFDASGKKAVVYDNKTQDKVLYLTFDCGYENGNTSKLLDTLKQKKVPAAFFCTQQHIDAAPELIARMIDEGHVVGNHSDKHPDFSSISRTRMAKELETVENTLRTKFGYTSRFFRFPEGAYSESALDLVDALGYTSVFWSSAYADWDTANAKGIQYAFDTVTSRLHPGAVILLHAVSPDNAAAMADIIDYARAHGYTFRSLEQLGK